MLRSDSDLVWRSVQLKGIEFWKEAMTGTALFPWETPLSSSDGLTEGTTVQVVSCASAADHALQTKKRKENGGETQWKGKKVGTGKVT